MATLAVTNTLNSLERTQLRNAEAVIQKHLGTFVEVGQALAEIRDKKLYRESHKTFEAYVSAKWDIKRDYAYKLIAASEATENVYHGIQKPASERQARPLTELPPEKQTEAWQAVMEKAKEEGKPVTAALVAEVVEDFKPTANGEGDLATSVLLAKNTDKIKPTPEQLEKLAAMPEKQQDAIMRAVDDGKTLAQALKNGKPENAQPTDALGNAVPKELVPVFSRVADFNAAMNTISQAKKVAHSFKDDPAGACVDWQELDRLLDQSRHLLKFSAPYCQCAKCRGTVKRNCPACHGRGWVHQSMFRSSFSDEDKAWLSK